MTHTADHDASGPRLGRLLSMFSATPVLRGALVASLALLIGCGPQDAGGAPGAGAPDGQERRAPKVLTVAVQREAPDFGYGTFVGSHSAGGASNIEAVAHDELAIATETGASEPQLAVELPSVERGTWVLHPDGRMDVTWRIRPNVRWHDGAPFTVTDLLFSFEVAKDPETGEGSATVALMESFSAPDPLTLVIRWSSIYVEANTSEPETIMPRHLLEDLFRNNKEQYRSSPRFTTEFIGLGPYRLVHWKQGSHIEFARFDDYYQGRPPFDRVIFRFIGDPNTMLANILAGEVDAVLPPGGPDLGAALEAQRRWEGTGNQVRIDPTDRLRYLHIQYRPEFARPENGLPNRTVRGALYRAIDRNTIGEVVTYGLAPVADSWFPSNHALRQAVQSAIPQFPHDPAGAQQLLTQAGWGRGADGVLVHQPSGERFETGITFDRGGDRERLAAIIADAWKALGVEAAVDPVPAARQGDREYESKRPGVVIKQPPSAGKFDVLHSSKITAAENRWRGTNRGGYYNPRVDTILDQLDMTIDPRARIDLDRQLLQEQLGDVAIMPLYWEIAPVLLLKGVKATRFANNSGGSVTGRFFLWDKK